MDNEVFKNLWIIYMNLFVLENRLMFLRLDKKSESIHVTISEFSFNNKDDPPALLIRLNVIEEDKNDNHVT